VAHGKPVVPRTGYLVEFNALWYNALRFSASIAEANGFSDLQTELEQQAAQTGASFLAVFYNKHGYLFDYVNGDIPEWSVRPSQIIAVSLNYSPLERVQKKTVLDFVTKELLTPKGLRSLSPKSPGYTPECIGNEEQRIRASNQGAAWPWLIGPYLEAYLKIYQTSGLIFAQRIIYGFEEELSERGIGTISELFDGDPPYKGRGGISYAMNVAELLRIHRLVKDKINQMQET
jgi:glycogen debranching enzyme